MLTEAVRRRPYQVILFDEVEKAHEDVFNVLLQVLDDGRLTDGQGRTVDFKNTLIVLTSNLGSEHLAAQPDGESTDDGARAGDGGGARAFRPEFLNRLDEIILFRRLQRATWRTSWRSSSSTCASCWPIARSRSKFDSKALQWLANGGYDPVYGARPLKRVIQRSLQNPLASQLLEGKIRDGDTVEIGVENGELTVGGEQRDERSGRLGRFERRRLTPTGERAASRRPFFVSVVVKPRRGRASALVPGRGDLGLVRVMRRNLLRRLVLVRGMRGRLRLVLHRGPGHGGVGRRRLARRDRRIDVLLRDQPGTCGDLRRRSPSPSGLRDRLLRAARPFLGLLPSPRRVLNCARYRCARPLKLAGPCRRVRPASQTSGPAD